ncbi:pilus assembly protein [Kineosporia sp. J2-2]|uniref:Pilus assembly protein n=1 Tax=Kineosporia corallincola TaxID=2835133 RepID=A0ABS5T8F9_9ACTN|nr:TadE family type IV pilus minor pilin [Kineosporia corallincola]MBT0767362.1 pilus assembly protein [Kineosporia corallincola]
MTHRSDRGHPTGVAPPRAPDHGSVTAEFALLMPVLVLFLVAVLAAATAGMAQLHCVDAARAGARAAARHDDPRPVAAAAGPAGAAVSVAGTGELVTVTVSAQVPLPLPWHPQIGVRARHTAQVEPQVGG